MSKINTNIDKIKFFEFLKTKKLKLTKQRVKIFDLFIREKDHLVIDDFFEKIQRIDRSVSISTLRRTLNLFAECGIAKRIKLDNGAYVFESNNVNHYHLICNKCHSIIEFSSKQINNIIKNISSDKGFNVKNFKLQIYGECYNCQNEIKSKVN